jgi:hypothetical protein
MPPLLLQTVKHYKDEKYTVALEKVLADKDDYCDEILYGK